MRREVLRARPKPARSGAFACAMTRPLILPGLPCLLVVRLPPCEPAAHIAMDGCLNGIPHTYRGPMPPSPMPLAQPLRAVSQAAWSANVISRTIRSASAGAGSALSSLSAPGRQNCARAARSSGRSGNDEHDRRRAWPHSHVAVLAATLTRAADYARAQAHREVTLEHMLLALCEDPEASVVLKSSNVNIARPDRRGLGLPRADADARRSRPSAEPSSQRPAPHSRTAAAAARSGRRREINGAIVLAAIVGDGKSAAAHVLRAQGLTFEGAIRALQSKPAEPEQRALPAPDAEAFLAGGARARAIAHGRDARAGCRAAARAHSTTAPRGADPQPLQVEARARCRLRAYEPSTPRARIPCRALARSIAPRPHTRLGPAYEPQQDRRSSRRRPPSRPYPGPSRGTKASLERSRSSKLRASGPPPMPASAPFPPPVPAPDTHDSWTPPPRHRRHSNSPLRRPASAAARPRIAAHAAALAGRASPRPPPWRRGRRRMTSQAGNPGPPMGYDNGGERFGRHSGRRAAPARCAGNVRRQLRRSPRSGQLVENIPRSHADRESRRSSRRASRAPTSRRSPKACRAAAQRITTRSTSPRPCRCACGARRRLLDRDALARDAVDRETCSA